MLVVATLFVGAAAVSAVTSPATSAGILRRENGAHQVNLDPAGHVLQVDTESLAEEERAQMQPQANMPTECDRQFILMAEGADECTGSGAPQEILFEGDCTHASEELSIGKADKFFLDTYKENPILAPKGCFLNTTSGKLTFNPEEVDISGRTLVGQKVCMRSKYINGTTGTNPDKGCTGDSVPILDYDACLAASLCAAGGGACKLQAFKDNVTSYKKNERPKGCFKDSIGCWGFNYMGTDPNGVINGTPICHNILPATSAAPAPAS